MTRSRFLRWMVWFGALILWPLRSFASQMTPKAIKPRETLPITPTPEFYVEDYAGPPGSLKSGAHEWTLKISGKVARPLTWTIRQMRQLPKAKRIITLNCIGNPVGGYAIGNAEWEGVLVRDVLELADPDFFSSHLVLRGEDEYQECLPLGQAKHPDALLAWDMNGEPLTLEHGFPLRLIVPGLYGIKQMKWIREIEVTNAEVAGHWAKQGWSRKARVKNFSRIDWPEDGAWFHAPTVIFKGVAFAGDRGVEYVQVSTDGEKTWQLVNLQPALSRNAWALWTHEHTFARAGVYTVSVRAADRFSGVQQDDLRDPFPNGTSGLHRITISIS